LKIPQDLHRSILQRTAKYRSETENFMCFLRKFDIKSESERALLVKVYFPTPKKLRRAVRITVRLLNIQGEPSGLIVREMAEMFCLSESGIRKILK
jgi:hypothetical protein